MLKKSAQIYEILKLNKMQVMNLTFQFKKKKNIYKINTKLKNSVELLF
jgi:hypothetical protein